MPRSDTSDTPNSHPSRGVEILGEIVWEQYKGELFVGRTRGAKRTDRLGSRTKVVIGFVTVASVLGATMFLFLRESPVGIAPFPVESAEKLSVDEVAAKFEEVGTLLLPTWMPDQVKLQEIYYIGMALLVYSDEDMVIKEGDDLLEGKVWIQLTKTDRSPTREELMNQSSAEVVKVGDYLVVIDEDPVPGPAWKKRGMKPILAYFYHNGYYYLISARKGETTREDLIRIVANMKPVGPETLRK